MADREMNPGLLLVNLLANLLFYALAIFANRCLLGRDDRNLSQAAMQERLRHEGGQAATRLSASKRLPAIQRPLPGMAKNPSLVSVPMFTAPVSPTSASRSSRASSRAPTEDVMEADLYHRGAVVGDEKDDADSSATQLSCSTLWQSHSFVASDVRCWFFVLVMVASWIECATGVLFMLQVQDADLHMRGNRVAQDLTVLPAILAVYVTFVSLLLILQHLVEKEVRTSALPEDESVSTLKIAVSFAAVLVPVVPCLFLTVFDVWGDALEVYSCAAEFCLCAAYTTAAFTLPRRVLSFGQGLQSVAGKIRNVCAVVAVCMLLRGIMILPPVQNEIGRMGKYAVPFLESVTTVPLYLSLVLLHQK